MIRPFHGEKLLVLTQNRNLKICGIYIGHLARAPKRSQMRTQMPPEIEIPLSVFAAGLLNAVNWDIAEIGDVIQIVIVNRGNESVPFTARCFGRVV